MVVLDVPLLVESKAYTTAGTIVVDTDPDIAVERLVAFRGFTEADARARMARQATREQRLEAADFVVRNDGTPDDLEPQIEACWDVDRGPPRRRGRGRRRARLGGLEAEPAGEVAA